ncbi:hypothetical protein R83H12_02086 [Fibrobacteria bacterium R8-3-H12]
MGEIYVLYGKKDCGKSSTIKEVYRILSLKYPNRIEKISITKPDEYDILAVEMCIKVEIQHNIKDLRIGIRSEGDTPKEIEKTLDDFANHKCDIIFCTRRTSNVSIKKKSTTIDNWIANSNPQYKVAQHFIQQKNTDETNQSRENWEQAKIMIDAAGL